jgi:peptidoglycan/LPS O-acetylase OafA/YrhL
MSILVATDSREVHASSDSEGKQLDIQGLRAVAVLAVIAFHVGLSVPGGFVGVDVFFVISGYVITMSMMKSLSGFTVESLPASFAADL